MPLQQPVKKIAFCGKIIRSLLAVSSNPEEIVFRELSFHNVDERTHKGVRDGTDPGFLRSDKGFLGSLHANRTIPSRDE